MPTLPPLHVKSGIKSRCKRYVPFVFIARKKAILFGAVKYDLFVIFFHDYSSSPSLYFLNPRVKAVIPAAITTNPKVLATPSFSPVLGRTPP